MRLGELGVWPSTTSIAAEARRLLLGVPAAKPGTHSEYSNANYATLGAIIEQVTGEPFELALNMLVTQPLGLTPTTSNPSLARDLRHLRQAELGETTGLDPALFAAAQEPLAKVDKFSQYVCGWVVRPLWDRHNFDAHWNDPTNLIL